MSNIWDTSYSSQSPQPVPSQFFQFVLSTRGSYTTCLFALTVSPYFVPAAVDLYRHYIAMSASSEESSDDLYEPGQSSSIETSDSDLSVSDSELSEEEYKSIIEDGWRFLSDIFTDVRPDAIPPFTDADAGISSALGPRPFTTPGAAFS